MMVFCRSCHGGDIDEFRKFLQGGARLAAILGGCFLSVCPVGVVDGNELAVVKFTVDASVVDADAAWADDAGANGLHDGIPQRVIWCLVANEKTSSLSRKRVRPASMAMATTPAAAAVCRVRGPTTGTSKRIS